MKHKYLLSIMILFVFLFLFSTTSLALIPGDFGSADNGPPDGVVDFEDLMIFALAYGSTSADANWNPDCDIYPDGVIDFEDLMIFALHYGEGAPPSAPILSDPGTNLPSPANYSVSWSSVSGATSYVLQEATSPDFTSGVQEYPLTDTSKDFSHTVSTTTTYYYRVAAVNDCGQSGWSSVKDITVVTGPVHNLTKGTYYDTIQAAIDDANSDNTIEVADGTYDESITFPSGKVIVLQSVNGGSSTIIRGNDGLNTVTFDGSLTGTILEGFTITHSEGSVGNGVYIVNSNLTINECNISGNTSIAGAGINNYGTLTITLSTISGNTGNVGAGIYNYINDSLTINGSDISANTAVNGGGIYNWYGILTITSSTIYSNTATGHGGGGIYNSGGTLIIASSTISYNTANYGGGIDNYEGTIDITGSTISGNNVSQQGGGIYLEGTETITIGGNDASDTSNFNRFADNKKGGTVSAEQHICNSSGDCRSSYPYNTYNPNN